MPTSTRKSPPERQPLLDLHVPQDPDGTVSATMPLAWCFKPGSHLAQQVEERGFTKPHLLVVVRRKIIEAIDKDYDYERWGDYKATLVPLTQRLQYVSFNSPGENQILAFVVDVANSIDMKQLRKELAHLNGGYYRDRSNFEDDGEYTPESSRVYHFDAQMFAHARFLDRKPDILRVHVPNEMFAPEPAEWRKRLVARLFGTSRAIDQCHFRKKFLASLVVAPFIIVGQTFSKLLFIVLAIPLFAPRRLKWRKFLDPWTGPGAVVAQSSDANSWYFMYPRADRAHYEELRWSWRSVLSPLIWWLPATIAYGITHIPVHYTGSKTRTHPWWTHAPGYWKFLLYFDVLPIVFVAAAFAVGFVLSWVVKAVLGVNIRFTSEDSRARRDARRRRAVEAERERLVRELEQMVCGDAPPPLSVGDLPRDKQTVYLRFTDFKTKVCKPFAR